MPPAPKRNSGVIIFDINTSNKDDALATLIKICTYKWLSDTKDTYKLILSNTKKSQNVKGYQNIYDTNITTCDPRLILNKVKDIEPEEGNWLDAILLGIHHLQEEFEKPGIITLQILYISNLNGTVQDLDNNKVERVIKDLIEYNIYLYIIGPKVKLPYTITSVDDVPDCMKKIKVDEDVPSLSAAKKIISNTDNTVLCDFKVGIHLFFSFQNPHGSQPWKVPLSFGTRLEIPVCTVKIYKRDVPFKLSRTAVDYAYVLLEDETAQVERDCLISGLTRHGKFVKSGESDMFKVEGPRSFSIVGFTSSDKVPEYYMRGDGTFFVLPNPEKTEDCCQAVYNLIDILAKTNKYAIVRRVYNNNNKPKFFVLVPQPDLEPKCFVMSELPYADEVKENCKFGELKASDDTSDEHDEFNQYFCSIDIWNPDCKISVPLSPKLMLDPFLSKLAGEAAKKYLERDFDFDTLDINDLEDSESNEFLNAFKESWPKVELDDAE